MAESPGGWSRGRCVSGSPCRASAAPRNRQPRQPRQPPAQQRSGSRHTASVTARGAASTPGRGWWVLWQRRSRMLVVVPVPQGPARLTLPTLIEDERPISAPGAVVGPDGEVRDGSSSSDEPSRAPAGQPGGYNGFASSMDTSVRGALGDEVVMRVRAPAADFWRGQTFSLFDGRTWFADDEIGTLPRRAADRSAASVW